MQPDRTRRLAEEPIPRLLLNFSLPAIVGMMTQALYYLVDRIFIGQKIGQLGIAAMTVAFPCMLVQLAFGMLVGFGAGAVVSLRLGAGKKDEAERVLGTATVLLILVSLVLTVAGLQVLDPLLRLFGASPDVLPLARDYLRIIVYWMLFYVVGFGLNAVIRGEGNPRIAMFTLLIGVLLNIVLAPIFIFWLDWGMKGAAAATVLSQAVSAVWVLVYFVSGRSHLKLRLKYLRFDLPICRTILAIGSPQFAMQMVNCLMNSLMYNQLGHYGGDQAISIWGIIYAIAMVVAMPIFGINQGVQPIIGFNYGAQKFDRVKQALLTAILAASTITVFGFAVSMGFPALMIRLFVHGEDAVAMVPLGTHAMRIALAMLPLIGFQVISASYFQAVGKPRQAMLLMLSRQVLLMIPAVLLLPYWFGLEGFWYAMPMADLLSSVLTAVCLTMELGHLNARHMETVARTANLAMDEPLAFDSPIPEELP